jgi:hypothetical protein
VQNFVRKCDVASSQLRFYMRIRLFRRKRFPYLAAQTVQDPQIFFEKGVMKLMTAYFQIHWNQPVWLELLAARDTQSLVLAAAHKFIRVRRVLQLHCLAGVIYPSGNHSTAFRIKQYPHYCEYSQRFDH